jgi:hypothetical protein
MDIHIQNYGHQLIPNISLFLSLEEYESCRRYVAIAQRGIFQGLEWEKLHTNPTLKVYLFEC